jgi:Polysaccharide pyruvyl transferase
MRIATLTLPLWNNYGGIIQAYALRRTLESLGFSATFIDLRRRPISMRDMLVRKLKKFVKKNILRRKDITVYPDDKQIEFISMNTRNFVESKIWPKTGIIYFDELNELNSQFDGFVVGSDQVWRPEYAPRISTYFLDFVLDGKARLAYSASFGTSEWKHQEEIRAYCAELLGKFDGVSVRENSAVSLVKTMFGMDSVQVCDPTLLISQADYIALASSGMSSSSRGNGIFEYVLDSSQCKIDVLSRLKQISPLDSFSILPKKFDFDFSSEPDCYVYPPIEDWLRAFNECEFVFTDSFHGCVFSLIFNKPFLVVGNYERGLARFDSLLSKFGLHHRLVFSPDDVTTSLISDEIDWQQVNKTISEEKAMALDFISSTLKKAAHAG